MSETDYACVVQVGTCTLCHTNSPLSGQRHVGANVELYCKALPAIFSEVSVKPVVNNPTSFAPQMIQVAQIWIAFSGMEHLRPTQ